MAVRSPWRPAGVFAKNACSQATRDDQVPPPNRLGCGFVAAGVAGWYFNPGACQTPPPVAGNSADAGVTTVGIRSPAVPAVTAVAPAADWLWLK
jgi:hypothetical protein